MVFNTDVNPDNAKLKDYFTWRETAVTEHQKVNLINKLAGEIVLKGKFLAYCNLSAAPERREDGKLAFPKGTKLTYFTLTTKSGQQVFPVFTDKEEIAKWKDAADREKVTMLVTFDDFVPILKSNNSIAGIVINPMSDNFPLSRKIVADWMTKKIQIVKNIMEQRKKKEESEKQEDR